MGTYQRSNFAETTLAAPIITTNGTAITVTSGASFPAVPFLVTIDTEILKCTDKGIGDIAWTVTRGEQSSTAATHLIAAAVQNNITAGDFTPLVEGPASAVDAHLAVFNSTTGKLIKDGGACTAAGLALLDDVNATAQIATLGLDADIATLSLPASTTITPAGAALIDDATAADQRTTLGGIVVGVASSLDNAVVRWDGATGKIVQDSNLIVTDSGQMTVSQDNADGAQLLVKGFTDVNKQIFFGVDTTNNIGILYAIWQTHDYLPLDLRGKVVCTSLSGLHVGGVSDPGDNNLLADGTGTITGAFGCNTKTAQTAYSGGAALNSYVTGLFGLDSAAHVSALYAMVVAIRAALVANGIMS
jgi:hypothetical protein